MNGLWQTVFFNGALFHEFEFALFYCCNNVCKIYYSLLPGFPLEVEMSHWSSPISLSTEMLLCSSTVTFLVCWHFLLITSWLNASRGQIWIVWAGAGILASLGTVNNMMGDQSLTRWINQRLISDVYWWEKPSSELWVNRWKKHETFAGILNMLVNVCNPVCAEYIQSKTVRANSFFWII